VLELLVGRVFEDNGLFAYYGGGKALMPCDVYTCLAASAKN